MCPVLAVGIPRVPQNQQDAPQTCFSALPGMQACLFTAHGASTREASSRESGADWRELAGDAGWVDFIMADSHEDFPLILSTMERPAVCRC